MTEDDFTSLMIRACTKITGIHFWRADEFDQPDSEDPFGTLNTIRTETRGIDAREFVDSTATPGPNGELAKELMTGDRSYTLSLTIYRGTTTVSLCERLKAAFRAESSMSHFFEDQPVGFTTASGVRKLYEVVDGIKEPKAQMDANFNIQICEEFWIFDINEVDIEVKVDNGIEQRLVETINVTKP